MICNITGLLHRHYDHHHHQHNHHHQHLCHPSWQLPVNIIPRTTIGLGINKKNYWSSSSLNHFHANADSGDIENTSAIGLDNHHDQNICY